MYLSTINQKLQVSLSATKTTNDMPVVISYEDSTGDIGSMDTLTTSGTTTVDFLLPPPPNVRRKLTDLTILNADTAAKTVRIYFTNNTVQFQVCNVTLQANDLLGYTETKGWYVVDANGNTKTNMTTATNLTLMDAVEVNVGSSGTAGTLDIFPATPAKGKVQFTKANNTNNDTTTMAFDAHGQATTIHVPDPSAAASYVVQSTAAMTLAQADVLASVTPGTAASNKALVLGAVGEISTITTATITTVNTGAIAATDASLGMDGQAAAQGGSVVVTGGTSSTAGNAGGAVSIVGGTPGITGVGGAITETTGAGGATSGASGDLTLSTGTTTAGSGSATGAVVVQSGAGASSAAAVSGGVSGAVTVRTQAGGANTGGATGQVGGAAGAVTVSSGNGGATNSVGAHAGGAGGEILVTAGNGGNATAGTGNGGKGGDIYLTPGTGGTTTGGVAGKNGNIYARGVLLNKQGAQAAKTTSATLTAAEVMTGIITVNQGGAGASAQQLPLATDLDAALPDSVATDSFDFSVINISAVGAETASVTTNTGWTLVGNMLIAANTAITDNSQGRFRAAKTGAGAWTLFRIS